MKSLKTTVAAGAVALALAGAAQAQQPLFAPTVEGRCLTANGLPTQLQRTAAAIVCSSPRLKAGAERNWTVTLQLAHLLSRDEAIEVASRMQARRREHLLYCRIDPERPAQLPISKATEECAGVAKALAEDDRHLFGDRRELVFEHRIGSPMERGYKVPISFLYKIVYFHALIALTRHQGLHTTG